MEVSSAPVISAYGSVPERVAADADYSIGPDVRRVLKLVERVVRGGRQKS